MGEEQNKKLAHHSQRKKIVSRKLTMKNINVLENRKLT
jgi:hypothetical protein